MECSVRPSAEDSEHREGQVGRKERSSTFHLEGVEAEADSGRGPAEISLRLNLEVLDDSQIGRAALLLAATKDPEDEAFLKEELQRIGWRSVATEVGGLAGDIPRKVTRAVVGASLNAGVVEKRPHEMHALMHATLEAMNAFMPTSMLEASIGAKIGIVRNRHWITVAILGDTAFHAVAHHERCGMGVMHI